MTLTPISLDTLAQQINATTDRAEAGRLLLEAKAALLVAGGIGWTKWVAANLERSERAAQRCITAAREEAADKERKSLVTPVDLVIAAKLADPQAVGKPTKVDEPVPGPAEVDEPQTFVNEPDVGKPTVDLPLAEATTQIVDDIADTLFVDEPVGHPTTEPQGGALAEDSELGDDPVPDAPEPATDGENLERVVDTPEPEPAIPLPPRAAQKLADLWLQLTSPRVRAECLAYTEQGCPDWPLFITSQEAARLTYDFREEVFNWSSIEVRAAFVAWARSLPEQRRAA